MCFPLRVCVCRLVGNEDPSAPGERSKLGISSLVRPPSNLRSALCTRNRREMDQQALVGELEQPCKSLVERHTSISFLVVLGRGSRELRVHIRDFLRAGAPSDGNATSQTCRGRPGIRHLPAWKRSIFRCFLVATLLRLAWERSKLSEVCFFQRRSGPSKWYVSRVVPLAAVILGRVHRYQHIPRPNLR